MRYAIPVVLLTLCSSCVDLRAQTLPRRADLGTAISTTPDAGPRILRFRPESVLERAGLKVGDEITELTSSRPARMAGDPLRDGRSG
jgi:C-terminal processing protease CtpA/Prc